MNANRRHAAAAALLATVATLGSVVALFHSASSAPGLPADRAAQAVARNDVSSGCLKTAAAHSEATSEATRVATR